MEIGLPEFSNNIYWLIAINLEKNLSWWQSFINWISSKVFSTFLSQLEALGFLSTPGEIGDVYEVYLIRNATSDMVNTREPSFLERVQALWDWLNNVMSFIPNG